MYVPIGNHPKKMLIMFLKITYNSHNICLLVHINTNKVPPKNKREKDLISLTTYSFTYLKNNNHG